MEQAHLDDEHLLEPIANTAENWQESNNDGNQGEHQLHNVQGCRLRHGCLYTESSDSLGYSGGVKARSLEEGRGREEGENSETA